jgi:hypothetical protein
VILVEAIIGADRHQKPLVITELDRLSKIEPVACYNLAQAYRLGDAGAANLEKAKYYLDACCAFGRGDRTHALALTVLGDLETMKTPQVKLGAAAHHYYRQAALTGHSPAAAFNCGLFYEENGNDAIAARFYLMAAEHSHPHAMTNLAGMIREGRFAGGSDHMRFLYESAAKLGDGAAQNAMRMIDTLVAQVDHPEAMKAHGAFSRMARRNPRIAADLIAILPIRQWMKILARKGWKLSNVRTRIAQDADRVAIAIATSGRTIPIHLTCADHVSGNLDHELLSDFETGSAPGMLSSYAVVS